MGNWLLIGIVFVMFVLAIFVYACVIVGDEDRWR